VVLVAVVLALIDDDPAGSPPPPGSPSPSTQTESASPTVDPESEQGTVEVEGVLDNAVLQLATGPQVRLVGVTVEGDCATSALASLVEGRAVSLTTPGADQDPDGRLLRYVDREGVDVGLRLIQRGLASASDEANPRRAIYRRVDERSPDVC
jgi:endonuclease YncB( thermonuclease family)